MNTFRNLYTLFSTFTNLLKFKSMSYGKWFPLTIHGLVCRFQLRENKCLTDFKIYFTLISMNSGHGVISMDQSAVILVDSSHDY